MKKVIPLLFASMMTVGTYAADGSDLWFANCKPENTQTPVIIKTSGIKADNTTLQIAKKELETMGLHGKVYLIVDNRWIRYSDAYSLTSYDGNITIRSASAQGLLYGTYDLLRR